MRVWYRWETTPLKGITDGQKSTRLGGEPPWSPLGGGGGAVDRLRDFGGGTLGQVAVGRCGRVGGCRFGGSLLGVLLVSWKDG